MLHFATPWFLLLVAVVPWLIVRYRRARPPSLVHPDLRLFGPSVPQPSWWVRHGTFTLRLAGLALLVLALSGPRWPDLRTRLDTEGVALLLVLDVSGSMSERDFFLDGQAVSRLEAVQQVFRAFVAGGVIDGARFEGRPADLVGMVRFAARPEVVCPPTLQHATLLRLLDEQEIDRDAGTNLPDAVTLGLVRLEAAPARRRVLLLLTDGEDNEPKNRSGLSTTQVAQLAHSLEIPIYAIDPVPPASGNPTAARLLAEQTLEEMARISGGRYVRAGETAALVEAYRTLDRLERAPLASFQYRRYHEGYPWLAAAALVCWTLAEVLTRTLWRRVPD
jgi:Ca-activated chloride channel family protein